MAELFTLSLGLTLIFELGYAWLWGVKGRDLILILLMNVLTNPLVVLWYHVHQDQNLLIHTVFPELIAIIVEIFILKRFAKDVRRPIQLGICINVFSYFLGMICVLIFF